MDVTDSLSDTSVWWTCTDCGGEVELPAPDTGPFLVPCPDCTGALHEMWRWDRAA